MKRTILIALTLLLTGTVAAQKEIIISSFDTTSDIGIHGVGWVLSHPLDNWMVSLQGGGHIYMGYEDGKGNLGDRITGIGELHLGRWIFPMVGIRAGIGFEHSHGFISTDSYLQNREQLTRDYGHCEGHSTSTLTIGGTTVNGALGGYYWTVDGRDDILIQNWKSTHIGADILINLSFMKEYQKIKPNKRWNHIVYAGFNVRVGLSEDNKEKFSNFFGYSTSDSFKGFKNTNFASEGHLGYFAQYELTKNFNIHADLKLSIIEGYFDRERVIGVETSAKDYDLSLMLGFSYDFNFRSEKARRNYYVERGILPYNATELPKHISFVQIQDVDIVQIFDTIVVVSYDTIDDIVIQHYYDSLVSYYDTLHANLIKPVSDTTTLDSILLKRLLPYEMVFFDRDKWDIRPQEEMKIAKMARIMKAYPNRKFILYGSADSKTGTVKRNTFLSHNRADVVRNRLIIEYGIPEKQVRCEYLGGIKDYDPFILNRTTVIIMEHPTVRKEFDKIKSKHKAGGYVVEF